MFDWFNSLRNWLTGVTDYARACRIFFPGLVGPEATSSLKIKWLGLRPCRIDVYKAHGANYRKIDFIGNASIIEGTMSAVLDEPKLKFMDGVFIVLKYKDEYDASTVTDVEIELNV